MPTYNVTDPTTGKSLKLTGDSPPTEQELNEIFTSAGGAAPVQSGGGAEEVPKWGQGSDVNANLYGVYGGVKAIGETIGNIPSSGLKFLENITTPILHPVKTAEGLYDAVTTSKGREAIQNFFIERYGGLDKLTATMKEDPVGFAADVSTVLTGAGSISELAKAGTLSEALSTAGRLTDPLRAAGKMVAKPAAALAEKVIAPSVGTAIGYSGEAVKTAFKGGKVFKAWMRGDQKAEEILNSVRGAVDDIADQRRTAYQRDLQVISQNRQAVNFAPVGQQLDAQLRKFNIKVDPNGILDFSRSTMDKRYLKDIQEIYDRVKGWGSEADDFTPKGMDILKQQLDEYFTEIPGGQKRIDAFLQPTKTKIVDSISAVAPEYPSMLRDYSQSMELQKTIQKAFSTRDKTAADTAVTKVIQSLRDSKEFRTHLVDIMDAQTGGDIREMIAGYQLRGYQPQSWIGRTLDIGAMFEVAAGAISPKFLAVLAISSPRIVGEFTAAFGRTYRLMSKTKQWLPSGIGMSAFQAGRASRINTPTLEE